MRAGRVPASTELLEAARRFGEHLMTSMGVDEVVDAEVVDAEVVDAEVVDAELPAGAVDVTDTPAGKSTMRALISGQLPDGPLFQ
jgi:hypothetical protein